MQERNIPRVEIDEVFIDEIRFLSYECFGEDGMRVGMCIPFDSTPEAIAKVIAQTSMDLLENLSEDVPVEQVLKMVKFLQDEAHKVPGLKNG